MTRAGHAWRGAHFLQGVKRLLIEFACALGGRQEGVCGPPQPWRDSGHRPLGLRGLVVDTFLDLLRPGRLPTGPTETRDPSHPSSVPVAVDRPVTAAPRSRSRGSQN